MKKRRTLLTLLALLLIVGIPIAFLVREYSQDRLNRELIEAIKVDDTDKALAALKAGADPNACDYSGTPRSLRMYIIQLFDKLNRPASKPETALMMVFDRGQHSYF